MTDELTQYAYTKKKRDVRKKCSTVQTYIKREIAMNTR